MNAPRPLPVRCREAVHPSWTTPRRRTPVMLRTTRSRILRARRGDPVSTLIAIGYPDATTGLCAAEAVDRLADDVAIQPEAAAAIGCLGDGEFWVTTTHEVVGNGESWGMFWELLFGLAFFAPLCGMPVGAGLGDLLGKIEKTGLDAELADQLRDLVRPGTSALFLVVTDVSPER